MTEQTISDVIAAYLDSVQLSRSKNTARTYKNALTVFQRVLKEYWIDPDASPTEKLTEDAIAWLAKYMKNFSASTERLYLTAVAGFYEYVAAERLAEINLPRLRLLIRQRARRPGIRLPQFPAENIDRMLEFATKLIEHTFEDEKAKLRALRDRAFLITLADTGLRVHEACNLRRGDMDWNEGRAIIVGKGDKQAVVRFSGRALGAIRDYLTARSRLDGASNRQLTALPLFARHDKGAGKKIKPISTTTGRNIIKERVRQALGDDALGTITPHSFRHYFVTTVLRASGNLKLAQELARHSNIQVTQRYAHLSDDELDKGYHEIFEGAK
jgi:site-specific recombinase XerD